MLDEELVGELVESDEEEVEVLELVEELEEEVVEVPVISD